MEHIHIETEFIRLDAAMKLSGLVDTGGQAKALIQGGEVLVNGEPMELTGSVWNEEIQDGVETPLPIRMENGALIAPTYLFSNGRTTGGVWSIGISHLHLDGGMEQDPDRSVVLP